VQTTSWLGVRDRNDDLMKISRRGSVHAVENQYTEFVLDALRDPQPMQVGEQWRDVFITLRPNVRRAAALMTDCSRSISQRESPENATLQ